MMPGETIGSVIARLIDNYESSQGFVSDGMKDNDLLLGLSYQSPPVVQVIQELQKQISVIEEQSGKAAASISLHEKNFGTLFQQIVEIQSREKIMMEDLDDFEDGLKR